MCNSNNVAVPRYSPGKGLGHLSTLVSTDVLSADCSPSYDGIIKQAPSPPVVTTADDGAAAAPQPNPVSTSSSSVASFSSSSSTEPSTTPSITIEELRAKDNLPGSKLPFLIKLHTLLDDVEKTGNDHIISWLSHGRSFKVHRPQSLMKYLAPYYFNQTKWKSFQRQLHLYEFARTPYGIEAGSYSHPQFVRGQPDLCLCLRPIKIKGQKKGEGRKKRIPVIFTTTPAVVATQPAVALSSSQLSQEQTPSISSSASTDVSNSITSSEHARWVAKIKSLVVNGSALSASTADVSTTTTTTVSRPQSSPQHLQQQQQPPPRPLQTFQVFPFHHQQDQQHQLYHHQQQQQTQDSTLMMTQSDEASSSMTEMPVPDLEPSLSFADGTDNSSTNMYCVVTTTNDSDGTPCSGFGSKKFNYVCTNHDVNCCNCCLSDHEDDNDDDEDDENNGEDSDDSENTGPDLTFHHYTTTTATTTTTGNNNYQYQYDGNYDEDDEAFAQEILAAIE